MAKLTDLDASRKYCLIPDFIVESDTEKAFLLSHREDPNVKVWVPKSQCKVEGNELTVRGDIVRARLSATALPGQQTLGKR